MPSGDEDIRQRQKPSFPNTNPDRRPSRPSPAGGAISLLSGIRVMGLRPPGKAMTKSHGEEGPGPGACEGRPAPGPNVGETSPGLQGRETPETGDRSTLPIVGKGVVYVDFGKNKIFALTDESDELLVFDNLAELAEELRSTVIVLDSLPGKLLNAAAELAKRGITFLRLKDLKKLSEERKKNGVQKSDENDVVALRTLFRRNPDDFQPLFETPEELIVRELTEEWATFTLIKMVAKQKRTATNHPLAIKAHRTLRNILDELSEETHREAMKLPLYRLTFEQLGLKGPALAYLLSHDYWALKTLPRTELETRYGMFPRPWRRMPLRLQLLDKLAFAAVTNKHPKYVSIYENYRRKGMKHWPAILRVAKRILRDIRKLARKTQEAGLSPPA
jgi:hypothetical protein